MCLQCTTVPEGTLPHTVPANYCGHADDIESALTLAIKLGHVHVASELLKLRVHPDQPNAYGEVCVIAVKTSATPRALHPPLSPHSNLASRVCGCRQASTDQCSH